LIDSNHYFIHFD